MSAPLAVVALASLSALAPDHARLQTGGYLGMVTAGVGYSMASDRVSIDGTYGWAPPRNGAPTAHLGTLTIGLRPLHVELGTRFVLVPLYANGGLFLGHNARERPPAVEDSPMVLWGVFSFGMELALYERGSGPITRHALYVEEVTLGPYFYSVVTNRGMHLTEAFSTALGYRASF